MLSRTFIVAAAAAVLSCGTFNRARAQFQYGEFVTFSQVSWGETPIFGNAAYVLLERFDLEYPAGLEVGVPGSSGHSMFFTSGSAVLNYLPASGSSGPLNNDLVDPTSSAAGFLGGTTLALQIDVDFSDAGILARPAEIAFGDLILHDMATASDYDMSAFDGFSVRQFLEVANGVLGGGIATFSYDAWWQVTDQLGLAFEFGQPNHWAQDHLRIPGDFNGDRKVDAADYVVWRKTDGTPAGYNEWGANFGWTVGGGATELAPGESPGAKGAAVPEPASLIVAALGISLLFIARSRAFDERSSHVCLMPFPSLCIGARGAGDIRRCAQSERPGVF